MGFTLLKYCFQNNIRFMIYCHQNCDKKDMFFDCPNMGKKWKIKKKLSKMDVYWSKLLPDKFNRQINVRAQTGANYYHFAKLILRDSLFWKTIIVYQQILISTLTWWYFEVTGKFYQKMSTDGARVFKYIGSDW